MSLFWRIFLLNAAVLAGATAVLLLTPLTVSTSLIVTEALILAAGLAAMLVANAALLRVGLAPLRRLTRVMATIDLTRPGTRLTISGHGLVADLITTFNTMLGRLEAERKSSAAQALSAQEGERRRIALELHDEVGQTLTAVLLQLKQVFDRAPECMRTDVARVQEMIQGSLDEIRRITRRLRPGDLETLGLISALTSLVNEYSTAEGLTVHRQLDTELTGLDHEAELVIYRVAQEGLTNVVRHAQANNADILLRRHSSGVELKIRDDGRGISNARAGTGLAGMRERALLIDADLAVGPGPNGGTQVRLYVPTARSR